MFGLIKRFASQARGVLIEPMLEAIQQIPRLPDAATQIQLQMDFRRLIEDGRPLPRTGDIGFKCYSQSDEDGILLFLFSILGTSTKLCARSVPATGSSAILRT